MRVGFVYLLSGFGGSILSALFIQRSISVGASGALFGLLGAMLSELLANWSIYTNKVAATLLLFVENAHINFFFSCNEETAIFFFLAFNSNTGAQLLFLFGFYFKYWHSIVIS